MKNIITVLLSLSVLGAIAQQDPQFTMNFANKLYNNPAYAGTNKICATGIFRQQWAGIEGAPRDILFSVHSPINLKIWEESQWINPGVGFTFIDDEIGPISTNGFKAAIANHFKFSSIGTISLGFGVGTMGVRIDGSKMRTPDGGIAGQGSSIQDPNILAAMGNRQYGFDMDFGLYYQSADEKIFAGASVAHLTKGNFSFEQDPTLGITKYQVQPHAYFMGGYRMNNFLGSEDWDLLPSAFVKTEFKTTQVDINVRAIKQNKIWAGVSWRFQDAAALMGGYNWHNVGGGKGTAKVGFSYDINTSKLFKHNVGSFEIFVNYCFGITPKPKISIHKNPLWL
ncbi:MAG: hypothetical protein CL840_10630 [Crocinitomicaceae bacterium]|nr:hypothetical protein [Crocinitomicaceae bacterium]|tara:strand:+ start:11825 stop:12841 length:1017 start_codon:yes stop_codon:yes gene_type:complete